MSSPRNGNGESDSKDPPSHAYDGTSVDLGDDLIQDRTVMLPGLPAPSSESEGEAVLPADPHDELASARILLNENLPEEAKKVLRKILLSEPSHVEARKLLSEIHENELKQIFGDGSLERRKRGSGDEPRLSAETVIENLDRDLALGLYGLEHSPDQLTFAIDDHLSPLTAKDHADVGIAFFEMGLYSLAIQQFRKAAKDPAHYVGATALLASAQIAAGQPFEATLALEPVVEDSDLEPRERVELYYLMGRAFEKLGKPDTANRWYREVGHIHPRYRDIDERLRRMGG